MRVAYFSALLLFVVSLVTACGTATELPQLVGKSLLLERNAYMTFCDVAQPSKDCRDWHDTLQLAIDEYTKLNNDLKALDDVDGGAQ